MSPEKQSKLKRLFRRTKASINEMFSRMQSVSSQIDRITIQLNQHKDHLSRDIALLDELYELNKNYFDDISLYILAAQQKKEAIQTETLPVCANIHNKITIKWLFKISPIWNNSLTD